MQLLNTYIAILRGINVSGKKLIKMDSLREMLISLGFESVKTYIQSGNVVFRAVSISTCELESIISKAINETYSFDVPVIVLDLSEIAILLEQNPMKLDYANELDKLHITLLSEEPDPANLVSLNNIDLSTDKFIIINKAIYLYCPNGYGNTKLNNNFFEKKLKVNATTRNLKTMTALLELGSSINH